MTPPRRYSPLGQLVLSRLREFLREPEAVFWVYLFPVLIVVALGIAFRNKPVEKINVDIEAAPGREKDIADIRQRLEKEKEENFVVQVNDEETSQLRLRTGKTDIVVILLDTGNGFNYRFDAARAEGRLARSKVDNALQRFRGREDAYKGKDLEMNEPGARYVDFLVPGLLGMGLMGGGLFGCGFAVVDMRIRKVLKRFIATPMRRSDFLLALIISRLILLVPEVLVLMLFARIAFGVVVQGSIIAMAVLILVGALTFAGLGLLVACRAKTLEAVSGLMNLVMLPMWILSGVFFSPERFPAAAQPFIHALPLTPLIEALRNVSLEGASLFDQGRQLAILAAWGFGSFFLALRWFRWK